MAEENWSKLLPYGHRVQFLPDTVIYLQSQAPNSLYYLEEGSVKSVILSDDGSEKILKVYLPGMLFGEAAFFDGMPRTTTAVATTASTVIQFERSAIADAFSRQPELAMQMLRYLAGKVRLLSDEVGSMAFLSARERVETYLTSLPQENGLVRATQDEIAGACGLSRITVSRILRQLKDEGVLETGYRTLKIL